MLKVRPATMDDEATLLTWRNDPETRRMSFTTEPIDEQTHHLWLAYWLASSDRCIFIAEIDGQQVGSVGAAHLNGEADVGISVAPQFRGKGYAASVLSESLRMMIRDGFASHFVARVKPENAKSITAFERVGFVRVDSTSGYVTLRYAA